jgi:hypothetical protein
MVQEMLGSVFGPAEIRETFSLCGANLVDCLEGALVLLKTEDGLY